MKKLAMLLVMGLVVFGVLFVVPNMFAFELPNVEYGMMKKDVETVLKGQFGEVKLEGFFREYDYLRVWDRMTFFGQKTVLVKLVFLQGVYTDTELYFKKGKKNNLLKTLTGKHGTPKKIGKAMWSWKTSDKKIVMTTKKLYAYGKHKSAHKKIHVKIMHHPLNITPKRGLNEVLRGMTAEQVLSVLGKPTTINKSVGSWGVREQWVYNRPILTDFSYKARQYFMFRIMMKTAKTKYLYFENGKLTSWQI